MRYDVAIVGAGVLGLAHAYQLARRGRRVIVLERHSYAHGASTRNFGMIWPIGQPFGDRFDLARRSRSIWLDVLQGAGLWHDPCGSLHLAYADDEWQVLNEYSALCRDHNVAHDLLDPATIGQRYPAVNRDHLIGGFASPFEVTVDPRDVIANLPAWLHREHRVDFEFGRVVQQIDGQTLIIFADTGMRPCKLQMMRTAPAPRVGTMLAAGLTLTHYTAFRACPTLPALIARLHREKPLHNRYGIHVMISQTASGQITIGDSHEYAADISPFDKVEIDDLILDELDRFLHYDRRQIVERWHGIYLKHPTEPFVFAPIRDNAWAVTGTGGAGMTLAFGLAEQVVDTLWGPHS
jgi:D-hydroxyproline dehydrogenase subunit beta